MKTFGQVVKEARIRKGLTLMQAAQCLYTVKGYICMIENTDVNPPSPRMTARMARLYGLDSRELITLGFLCKAPKIIRKSIMEKFYGSNGD